MPEIIELLTASSVHIVARGVNVVLGLSRDGHIRARRAEGSLRAEVSASSLHITTEPEGRLVARVPGVTTTTRAGRNVISTSGDLVIGGRQAAESPITPSSLTVDVPPGTWVVIERAASFEFVGAGAQSSLIVHDQRSTNRR